MSPSPALAHPATAERALLCVDAAERRCGLPVEAVVEIHPAVQLVPLPEAPRSVLGLVNRRGAAVPVIGLRERLGLPERSLCRSDRLVVLQVPERQLALLVDAAVDVLDVPATAVVAAAALATEDLLAQGVAVLPDGLLVVLDVEAFLSVEETLALDRALQQALEESRR